MKRFTSLDISAITRELREKVVGLRIANVYDLGKKTYQLKLAKPDHKQYLVFESGVRLHTTKFQRERQTVPSVFCLKLRRYLRTKRIEDVRQLGIDRVIDITIGSGEAQHHLIIELYASGNIILVDKNYAIETLIRSYKTGEGTDDEVSVAVGTRYPVDKARQLVPTTVDRLREVLHSVPEELRAKEAVKDVLNRHLDLGPALFEHCLLCADLKPHAKVSEYEEAKTEALHRAIQHAESLYSDPTLKGYIVLKDTKPDAAPAAPAKAPPGKGKGKETKQQPPQQPQEEEGRAEEEAQSSVVSATPAPQDAAKPDGEEDYDSRLFMMFVPYVYKQFEGRPRLEFPSFDEAVDIFFSKAQEQQVEVKKEQQEKTVIKKLDKVKKDHETRIAALTKAEEECIKKAHLIETNVSDVDAAIKVTCSELARGMDWAQLTRVVKEAKKAGDPIANLIHSLDFANNRITLLLVDPLEAAADASGAMQKVEVDIGQTAYANAQEFYAEAKRRAHKHAKTVASSQMAVKAAEKKARREIKDVGVKAAIQKVRKAYWFEKFHWFISSENYVVISGRDAQQNELIVKRYLRKGDAYVHADLHGAATCVVKNPHPDKPIPALTLAEAGSMTVCRSSAWTAKIPTSAWWVHPEQVSKTAPSGEYLVTGSFMIRGKKNFLPPSQLVMGFAYMFKVDPTSVANHVNERAVRTLVELSELEGAGRGDAERSAAGGSDGEDQDSDGDGKAVEGGAKGHAGKYRVQVLMDTPDDDADAGSSSQGTPLQPRPPQKEREKRARMSAAEKRRKKKLEKRGESAAAAPADEEPSPDHHHHRHRQEEEEEDEEEGEEEAQQQPQQQPKTKGPTQPKLLRGQKGKMKKMKKKYAEQDEEERDLRMRLLQSEGLKKKEEQRLKELELQKKRKGKGRGQAGRGGLPYHHHQQQQQQQQQGAGRGEAARAGRGLPQKTPASPPGEGKEDGEEEVALAQPADEDVARVVAGGGGVAMEAGDGGRDEGKEEARDEEGEGVAEAESTGVVEEEEEEEEGLEAKRKRRQEKRHEKKKEAEEIRQIMEEENIKPLDESLLSEIDALTGVPVVEDALLFAVPVCAPYSVVQNYKYKIKLVPGSVKRGKAAKEAMSYFVSFPEATDRERDLLKAVEDSEIVLQLIGNVRIATSGLKQKAKSGKKGKSGKKK